MKQKYIVVKDTETQQITIKEFAELDRELFSLLCEESYDQKAVEAAIETGKNTLVALLKTQNMYPPALYFEKICDAVMELCAKTDLTTTEVFINDHELLAEEMKSAEADLKANSEDLDELLEEDNYNEESSEIEALDNSKTPLKIADDESVDVGDDA